MFKLFIGFLFVVIPMTMKTSSKELAALAVFTGGILMAFGLDNIGRWLLKDLKK